MRNRAARAAALREAGRLHEARGEFEAARDAFERALTLTSRDNWLHGELLAAIIRLYARAGRTPELEARWRQAAESAPRDLGGYLRLEALAEAQADPKAEVEWLQRITTLAPRDRDSRLKLARLLVDTGERDRAAVLYDQLLAEQPDRLDLVIARADLDLQLGEPAAAVRRLEARLAANPADETVSAPVLEFFLSRHLDDAAERCLRSALVRRPEAPEAGVALAKFYLARRRTEDARRVLDRLAESPGEPAARSARWQLVAAVYRDAQLSDDALRCWREAARTAPRDPVPLRAAGELLLARGDPRGAAEALEKAVALSPEGAAHEELEHQLFQVLSVRPASTEAGGVAVASPAPRHLARGSAGGAIPGLPESGIVDAGGPLDQYLAGLEEAADRQPTPVNYLRLARWQFWARLLNEAADSLGKVIALDPANLPARQWLIRVALEARQHELAAKELRELIALDPPQKLAYLRQLASMQMEDGDFDAAVAGYGELERAQPGALEPLTDLALAQERADRWLDALATWKAAYALPTLTPAQRGGVRRPLVAAYEHLGAFQTAAELLARAVDEEPELARRQELFQSLREYCGKHALLGWLGGEYEKRLRTHPDDYFTMVAAAALRKDQGRDEDAYELLRQAYFSAPDPAAALKSLADEAEALGDGARAVGDRRRLVAITGQDTADNLERLAATEEDDLDEKEAADTWERIARRFPRDTNALGLAADFFERIARPERARALLEQVVAVEPEDLPRLFRLAELARDAGDEAGARERFAQVLARSDAEKPGEPLQLPADLELAADPSISFGGPGISSGFRSAESPPSRSPAPRSDDRALRLKAIRALAQLLPGDARDSWLRPWRAAAAGGARSEPLQACYSSGDRAGTMDLLSGWLAARPADEPLRGAFLLAGLRLGDYERLARWAWLDGDPTQRAARGSLLVDALEQFLAAGGQPDTRIVRELFPPQVRARDLLWKAAKAGLRRPALVCAGGGTRRAGGCPGGERPAFVRRRPGAVGNCSSTARTGRARSCATR